MEPFPFCVDVGEDGRWDFGIRYKDDSMGSVCSGRSAYRNVKPEHVSRAGENRWGRTPSR